jgi:hypothetical protein
MEKHKDVWRIRSTYFMKAYVLIHARVHVYYFPVICTAQGLVRNEMLKNVLTRVKC